MTSFDVLAMGRSSIDLYSNDVGKPFVEITSFAAYVGGCPTNVSVGTRRLGLRSVLLTAVGDDPVGDFVLHFLEREGVETRYVARKPGRRTSAVLLGIEPPDRFPLVFYRDNCADIELTAEDVYATPVADCRALFISGTGLSREPSRSATLLAARNAKAAGKTVFLDLDWRPHLWQDEREYAPTIGEALESVDVAIGNEEEVRAAGVGGAAAVLVTKRGARGASVRAGGEDVEVPGFAVEVLNVLGAGDAFASGLLYGSLQGWGWRRSARMGNAVGAIVVTRPACANSMPTLAEVEAFVAERGRL